jgi:hypothetical protein
MIVEHCFSVFFGTFNVYRITMKLYDKYHKVGISHVQTGKGTPYL